MSPENQLSPSLFSSFHLCPCRITLYPLSTQPPSLLVLPAFSLLPLLVFSLSLSFSSLLLLDCSVRHCSPRPQGLNETLLGGTGLTASALVVISDQIHHCHHLLPSCLFDLLGQQHPGFGLVGIWCVWGCLRSLTQVWWRKPESVRHVPPLTLSERTPQEMVRCPPAGGMDPGHKLDRKLVGGIKLRL